MDVKTTQPPQVIMSDMARWYVVSRCIHVIGQLGIANYVDKIPISIQDLSKSTKTDANNLLRLMRFLTSYEIFAEPKPGYFSATTLSDTLRDDSPNSIRSILCMFDNAWWNAAGCLTNAIQNNSVPFQDTNSKLFFDYLAENAERQKKFDNGMATISRGDDAAIAKAYNFNHIKTIVDVGGGQGGLLSEILKLNDHIQAVLFDQEKVIKNPIRLIENNLIDRCELVNGNFFNTLPKEKDLYIYKGVLHDFNDENTLKILENTKKHMSPHSQLLIAEQIIPDESGPHPNKTMDIVMMFLLGGRQRNLKEWEAITSQAGFILKNAIKTSSLFTILEFNQN